MASTLQKGWIHCGRSMSHAVERASRSKSGQLRENSPPLRGKRARTRGEAVLVWQPWTQYDIGECMVAIVMKDYFPCWHIMMTVPIWPDASRGCGGSKELFNPECVPCRRSTFINISQSHSPIVADHSFSIHCLLLFCSYSLLLMNLRK